MKQFVIALTFALAFASCVGEALPDLPKEVDGCSFTMPASCPALGDGVLSDTIIWENYYFSATFNGSYEFEADVADAQVVDDSTFGVHGRQYDGFVIHNDEWIHESGTAGGLGLQMPNCGEVGCYDLNEFGGYTMYGKDYNLFYAPIDGGDLFHEIWLFLSDPDYPAEVCITALSPEDCSVTGTFHGYMVVDLRGDSLKRIHPDFADTIQVTDGRFHARLASSR